MEEPNADGVVVEEPKAEIELPVFPKADGLPLLAKAPNADVFPKADGVEEGAAALLTPLRS